MKKEMILKIVAWAFSLVVITMISLVMYTFLEDGYGYTVFAEQGVRLSQADIFWGIVNSDPWSLLEVMFLPIIWLILFVASLVYKGSWYKIVPLIVLLVLASFFVNF